MNVTLTLNGTSITEYTLSYDRDQKVCSGVGTIELYLSGNCPLSISTWSTIVLYEEGNKVGTYSVYEFSYDLPSYQIIIKAQDDSKKLMEYFIAEDYNTEDYVFNNQYWIEKFLAEATVSYSFNSGLTPAILSNNTYLGKTTAYDQITTLLQMSGWYLYFNENNVCIIGKTEVDLTSPDFSLNETDITSVKTTKADTLLRNRAVVWGTSDTVGKEWVFADVKRTTPWDYSEGNSRTVVLSNSNIKTNAAAYSVGTKMLDEWATILYTKELVLTGARNIHLGDAISVNSEMYSGIGVVTTVGTKLSDQGLETLITLDEKCSRLFGIFGLSGWVYVGTWGSGVKRKSTKGGPWYNYSTGLSDLYINDLSVSDGILTCTTQAGHAYLSKEFNGYWQRIYTPAGTRARACTLDKDTNNIRLVIDADTRDNQLDIYASGITYSGELAYVMDVTPNNFVVGTYPISGVYHNYTVISGVDERPPIPLSGIIVGFDIDNDGYNDYISIGTPASGWVYGIAPADLGESDYVYGCGISTYMTEFYDDVYPVTVHSEITLTADGELGFHAASSAERLDRYAIMAKPIQHSFTVTHSIIINDGFHETGGGAGIVFFPEEKLASTPTPSYSVTGKTNIQYTNRGDPPESPASAMAFQAWGPGVPYTLPNTYRNWNVIGWEASIESSFVWSEGYIDEYGSWAIPSWYLADGVFGSQVIRRDGNEFTQIYRSSHRIRIDSSSAYPLLGVQEPASTLEILDNSRNEEVQLIVSYPILNAGTVGDLRSTYTASGVGTYANNVFITISGGLYSWPIEDTEPVLVPIPVASGVEGFSAVEISNYNSEVPFLFVATSGDSPSFYQQDDLPFREESSGLGSSPVTIIRLDDSL